MATTSYLYKEDTFFRFLEIIINQASMPSTTFKSCSNLRVSRNQLYKVSNYWQGIRYAPINLIEAVASLEKIKSKRKKSFSDFEKVLKKSDYSENIIEGVNKMLRLSNPQANFFVDIDLRKPSDNYSETMANVVLNNSTSSLPSLQMFYEVSKDQKSYVFIIPQTIYGDVKSPRFENREENPLNILFDTNTRGGWSTFTSFKKWFDFNFKDELNHLEETRTTIWEVLSTQNLNSIPSNKTRGKNYYFKGEWKDMLAWSKLNEFLRLYFSVNFQNKLLEYSFNSKISYLKSAINYVKTSSAVSGGVSIVEYTNNIFKFFTGTKKNNKLRESIKAILTARGFGNDVQTAGNNDNSNAIAVLVSQIFKDNSFIAEYANDSGDDFAFNEAIQTFVNMMGFAISTPTRVPTNATFSIKYLLADLTNYKYKITSDTASDDSVTYNGYAEGYVNTKKQSKFFSALKGDLNPFYYRTANFDEGKPYDQPNAYERKYDITYNYLNSRVLLSDKTDLGYNNEKAINQLQDFNFYNTKDDEFSSYLFFDVKNNSNFLNGQFLVNHYDPFMYFDREFRYGLISLFAIEYDNDNKPTINSELLDISYNWLKPKKSVDFLKSVELNKDYLGDSIKGENYTDLKSFDEMEMSSMENKIKYYNRGKSGFWDILSTNSDFYLKDKYLRESDYDASQALNYYANTKFSFSKPRFELNKNGLGYDTSKPLSKEKLISNLEFNIKNKLLSNYRFFSDFKDVPFTAVTSFKKGDVVIVSSVYSNEMFGYLTPSFVYENDYTNAPDFKATSFAISKLGINSPNLNSKNYFRGTPIDVCYAVVQEDMPKDFDVVSDSVNCSCVYEYKGKTIIENWALPLANFYSQTGVKTLDLMPRNLKDDNELDTNVAIVLQSEIEAKGTTLATYLSNAAQTSNLNAFIRPAFTNIYSKEFTYYELSGYLMDDTNIAKKIGGIQRAYNDFEPKLLNLETFKAEYNMAIGQEDLLKDLTKDYFKGKEDTIVYKFLKGNIKDFLSIYTKNKKGALDVFKALNSLAKYEAECYVDDGSSKPKTSRKEDLKSLIDNI